MTNQPATTKPADKTPTTAGQRVVITLTVLGICGMILFFLGHKSVIHGTRTAVGQPMNATVENSFLGLVPLGQNEFPGLKKASLGVTHSGKNYTSSYNTWVDCDRGYVALISVSGGSEDSHLALIREINAAVDDPAVLAFSAVYGPHPLFNLALILVASGVMVSAVVMRRTAGTGS